MTGEEEGGGIVSKDGGEEGEWGRRRGIEWITEAKGGQWVSGEEEEGGPVGQDETRREGVREINEGGEWQRKEGSERRVGMEEGWLRV